MGSKTVAFLFLCYRELQGELPALALFEALNGVPSARTLAD